MSVDSSGFQEKLRAIYQQHRQQGMESDLDAVADTMEETLLEAELAQAFLGMEIEIDSEVKRAVYEARSNLESSEYDALGEMLPEVSEAVEEQRRVVSNQVHQARIEIHQTVRGMIRLNDRVGRGDSDALAELDTLLDDWNWQAEIEADTIGDKKQEIRDFGRGMRETLEDAKDDLFGPYRDTPLSELVDELLDDERLTLAALSEEEVVRLRESDLADYLEVQLS